MATAGAAGRGARIVRFCLRYTGRLILGLGVGWAVAGVAGFLIYGIQQLLEARFGTGRASSVRDAVLAGGLLGSSLGATAGAVLGAWLAPGPSPEFRRRTLWRSVWSALAATLLGAVSGALCMYVAIDRRPVGDLAALSASGVLAGVVGAALVVLYTRRSARAGRWRHVVRAAAVLGMAIVPCAPPIAWLLSGAVAEMRHGDAEPIHEGKTTWQWIEELEGGRGGRRLYAVDALRYASARMRHPAPPLDQAQVSAAVAALTRALDDGTVRIRRDAADALAHFDRDAHSAVPRLRQALKDVDPGVRVRAARALYIIGEPSPEALTVLLEP
jgi:hypothetical protein